MLLRFTTQASPPVFPTPCPLIVWCQQIPLKGNRSGQNFEGKQSATRQWLLAGAAGVGGLGGLGVDQGFEMELPVEEE